MAQIEKENCDGCGDCVRACSQKAIKIDENGQAEIDQEKCQKCGRCVDVCPQSAITTTDEI